MVIYSTYGNVTIYRKLHSIDYDVLCDDINNSALIKEPSSHLDILVYQYDNMLRSLLEMHLSSNMWLQLVHQHPGIQLRFLKIDALEEN